MAELFTTAKTRKQPRCPSIDEWIKKMRYIYAMEYYSIRMKFAAKWMDLEIVILNEVLDKDKYHMLSLMCGI